MTGGRLNMRVGYFVKGNDLGGRRSAAISSTRPFALILRLCPVIAAGVIIPLPAGMRRAWSRTGTFHGRDADKIALGAAHPQDGLMHGRKTVNLAVRCSPSRKLRFNCAIASRRNAGSPSVRTFHI